MKMLSNDKFQMWTKEEGNKPYGDKYNVPVWMFYVHKYILQY